MNAPISLRLALAWCFALFAAATASAQPAYVKLEKIDPQVSNQDPGSTRRHQFTPLGLSEDGIIIGSIPDILLPTRISDVSAYYNPANQSVILLTPANNKTASNQDNYEWGYFAAINIGGTAAGFLRGEIDHSADNGSSSLEYYIHWFRCSSEGLEQIASYTKDSGYFGEFTGEVVDINSSKTMLSTKEQAATFGEHSVLIMADGSLKDLGDIGVPLAINDLGQVLIEGPLQEGTLGIVDADGTHHTIPPPVAQSYVGNAHGDLNNAGDVATVISYEGDGPRFGRHAGLYRDGAWTDLDSLLPVNCYESTTFDYRQTLNESSQVVFTATVAGSFKQIACLYSGGTSYDLNQLAALLLSHDGSEGFIELYEADVINNQGQILGLGTYHDATGDHRSTCFLLSPQPAEAGSITIRDVSRTGTALSFVPDAILRISDGTQVIGRLTADGMGRIKIPDNGLLDPDQVYDFELEVTTPGAGTLHRTYQSLRASEVMEGAVSLALPVTLRTRLEQELGKLEATAALVIPYDTSAARRLLDDWNTAQPESPAELSARDHALGRLLTASESLEQLYNSMQPVAFDAAKLTATTLLSALATQQAIDKVNQSVARYVAGLKGQAVGTTVLKAASEAFSESLLAAKLSLDLLKTNFIKTIKGSVPPWTSTLLDQGIGVILSSANTAFSTGEYNRSDLQAGARKAILESLIKTLSEQVGGRIIGSAYVKETQSNLALAITRARSQQGSGTVGEGYVSSQDAVIAATERNSQALDFSATIASTTKSFGQVAEVASLVGKAPALQIAALIANQIRVLNVILLAEATINDVGSVLQNTFNDAPDAADRAFKPAVKSPVKPSVAAAFPLPTTSAAVASILPTNYATALATTRDAVAADDLETAVNAGEALQAAEDDLQAVVSAAILRIDALTHAASEVQQSELASAERNLTAAANELDLARIDCHIGFACFLAPDLADPSITQDSIITRFNAVLTALDPFDAAYTEAISLAQNDGLSAPASLYITDTGIDGQSITGVVSPGEVVVSTHVVNAGDEPATDVTVQLVIPESDSLVPTFALLSPVTQTIDELAAGESRTLSWNARVTDNSASGTGSGGYYTLVASLSSGETTQESEAFFVSPPNSSYDTWIAAFPLVGDLTGFADDPDGDGVPNGLERFLGTDPTIAAPSSDSLRLVETQSDGFMLEHPRAFAPGSDAAADYEWSRDLLNWHASGESDGEVSVLLTPLVSSAGDTGPATVDLLPEVTGNAPRLFYRLTVSSQPASTETIPDEPPSIILSPFDVNFFEGDSFTLSVAVEGTEPLFYTWTKDGEIISGATENVLEITDATSADEGTYQVRITGPGGTATSDPAHCILESSGGGGGGT